MEIVHSVTVAVPQSPASGIDRPICSTLPLNLYYEWKLIHKSDALTELSNLRKGYILS